MENLQKVWRIDIFPENFSKIAVDKAGENSGKPVEGLVKTDARICNNPFARISIGMGQARPGPRHNVRARGISLEQPKGGEAGG